MTNALRFFELWNEGRIVESLNGVIPEYWYHDSIMGGPHDRVAHIEMMEAVLRSVPDRRAAVEGHWRAGDVEFVRYRWIGTPAGREKTASEWLALFEFEGSALKSQRHFRG